MKTKTVNKLFMCGGSIAVIAGYAITSTMPLLEIIGAPMFALGVLWFGAGFLDEIFRKD